MSYTVSARTDSIAKGQAQPTTQYFQHLYLKRFPGVHKLKASILNSSVQIDSLWACSQSEVESLGYCSRTATYVVLSLSQQYYLICGPWWFIALNIICFITCWNVSEISSLANKCVLSHCKEVFITAYNCLPYSLAAGWWGREGTCCPLLCVQRGGSWALWCVGWTDIKT